MHYVISDIHGCYKEFKAALELIDFSDDDTLYVLGDCVDRGPEPIALLLDMMCRPNVIPICGNHDFVALSLLRKLNQNITEDNYDKIITKEVMEDLTAWVEEGGDVTLKQFQQLGSEDRAEVIEYLLDFSLYEEVEVSGRKFLLIHGGLEPFVEGQSIEDYTLDRLLFSRADYDRVYFPDVYTVTGHTPTVFEKGNNGTIIRRNNHIAIDCGCVGGFNLAVFCMETEQEFYVKFGST